MVSVQLLPLKLAIHLTVKILVLKTERGFFIR